MEDHSTGGLEGVAGHVGPRVPVTIPSLPILILVIVVLFGEFIFQKNKQKKNSRLKFKQNRVHVIVAVESPASTSFFF